MPGRVTGSGARFDAVSWSSSRRPRRRWRGTPGDDRLIRLLARVARGGPRQGSTPAGAHARRGPLKRLERQGLGCGSNNSRKISLFDGFSENCFVSPASKQRHAPSALATGGRATRRGGRNDFVNCDSACRVSAGRSRADHERFAPVLLRSRMGHSSSERFSQRVCVVRRALRGEREGRRRPRGNWRPRR